MKNIISILLCLYFFCGILNAQNKLDPKPLGFAKDSYDSQYVIQNYSGFMLGWNIFNYEFQITNYVNSSSNLVLTKSLLTLDLIINNFNFEIYTLYSF